MGVSVLDNLVKGYLILEDSEALKKIIYQCDKMLYKMLSNKALPAIVKDDILHNCRTLVVTKAIKNFRSFKGAKFQTFLYWMFRREIYKVIKKYNRKRRIPVYNLISIDNDDNSIFADKLSYKYNKFGVTKRVEFEDSVKYLKSKLSRVGNQIIKLLMRGYSRNQAFTKINIMNYKRRKKILREIRIKTREAFNVY